MKPIRWGIIGCGDVAEKKGGPALYSAPGSELAAVMSRDPARAEDFAARHGARRAYSRIEDLLADPEIDAVYVATPPHVHREQTLRAAAAGKHVLVEKPMALNGAECDEMIAACDAAGVHLHVAYYRRFFPKWIHARDLIRQGRLGEVLGARIQVCARPGPSGWRVDPAISGGGHFVDIGSHRIDMALFLLGDVVEVAGFAANRLGHHAAENDVVFTMRTASNVLISASFHFHTSPGRDTVEIYGSEGTLAVEPFGGDSVTISGSAAPADPLPRHPEPSPTHLPFVQALVDVYRGADIAHVTGREGAKTTRIMDTVLRGFYSDEK